jgi:hypothetical protein
MCLEAAQRIATLIVETLEHDQAQAEPIGLLPWWYRLYYLHIAGANFLAAMISRELFTESAARSWEEVLGALHAHEHLCGYAVQCGRTFAMLAGRIRRVGGGGLDVSTCEGSVGGAGSNASAGADVGASSLEMDESPPGISFDELFQDIDFDMDGFLFGASPFGQGGV